MDPTENKQENSPNDDDDFSSPTNANNPNEIAVHNTDPLRNHDDLGRSDPSLAANGQSLSEQKDPTEHLHHHPVAYPLLLLSCS